MFEDIINEQDIEFIIRLSIAVLLGAIIGYEREISQKPAGLRTHIFVCMGSCLFTISSFYLLADGTLGSFDATRIAAGIVTGISFIGAGSIIAAKGDVRGLTTAASLWVVSAIGLLVGSSVIIAFFPSHFFNNLIWVLLPLPSIPSKVINM